PDITGPVPAMIWPRPADPEVRATVARSSGGTSARAATDAIVNVAPQVVEACRVVAYELHVVQLLLQHDADDGREDLCVASRAGLQVHVCALRDVRPARIDDEQ